MKKFKRYEFSGRDLVKDVFDKRLAHIERYLEEQSQYCHVYYCTYHDKHDTCNWEQPKIECNHESLKRISADINIYQCAQDNCDFSLKIPEAEVK